MGKVAAKRNSPRCRHFWLPGLLPALLALPLSAQTVAQELPPNFPPNLPFSTAPYSSWYKLPDSEGEGMRIERPHVLLARTACQASGELPHDARQAITYWAPIAEVRHECWTQEGDQIRICKVGRQPTMALGKACFKVPAERFTALPAAAAASQ